ncbi:alpha/beta hydrolase [Nocardia sp. NPDC005825]|uniref:alpha/beta hydrolase n=1 Tax=unclassified Nocardia TaxID=2637762 RepID=UPI0033FA46CB
MPNRLHHSTENVTRFMVRRLAALPPSVKRCFAGTPTRIDGQQLDVDAQLGARLLRAVSSEDLDRQPISRIRARLSTDARIHGDRLPIENIRDITIPGPDGEIAARLYRPAGLLGRTPALVYYHGGGWTLGDLDTDSVARFLAHHAALTVISIDYRLAPEHPFPAGVSDSIAAFDHVAAHSDLYDIDPAAIAVGGESAGGNLAAVVAQQTTLAARTTPTPVPAFQLLFMPVTDLSTEHDSYRLFGTIPFLTTTHMRWFREQYLTDPALDHDPRVSPRLTEDLRGMPPAYIATAGFDILRDEGEAYAHKLAAAGVPVALHRHTDMTHGLINATGTSQRARDALHQAAGALRVGITFHTNPKSS